MDHANDSSERQSSGDNALVPSTAQPTRNTHWARRYLDDIIKPVFDLQNAQIGHNISSFLRDRQPLVWLLALLIGIAVAYVAVAFRWSIGMFQLLWLGTQSEKVASAATEAGWLVILLAPAFGGAIVGFILHKHMPGRRAQGVADVIEARAVHDSNISVKSGIWSAIAASVSLGFGASAGREGPVVHIGATIASFVENFFKLTHGTRRQTSCGKIRP